MIITINHLKMQYGIIVHIILLAQNEKKKPTNTVMKKVQLILNKTDTFTTKKHLVSFQTYLLTQNH